MTHADDITGIARCSCRRVVQDETDLQVWEWLESRHPGLLDDVHSKRGPGERLHVPQAIERPRERAQRMDDGVMSVRTLAVVAGVAYGTAWAARNEKSRE